jgi:hypothetical protein
LEFDRSTIGRTIANITRIIKIAITIKAMRTLLGDIFMIAAANRLVQSAELIENGLMLTEEE